MFDKTLLLLYFIAGLFAPALPWAPLLSAITSSIGLGRRLRDDAFLGRWWEVAPARAVGIVAVRLTLSIALDTLAMFAGNAVRTLV